MDGDVVADVAVLNGTNVVSHNAAYILPAGDAGIAEGDVLDGGKIGFAEEALVVIASGAASLVDADAADGVATAVEGATEIFIRPTVSSGVDSSTNGGVVVLGAGGVVPFSGVSVCDIVTQLEERVVEFVAVVHLAGEQVEACGGGDDVGALLGGAVMIGVGVPPISNVRH